MKKYNTELICFLIIYLTLFSVAIISRDSIIALISAFCGITYTILAGKGIPACYLIGVSGSILYSYLSFKSALLGNLLLYAGYYVPMQIFGFFLWNKNLKKQKHEIVKTKLKQKETLILFTITAFLSFVTIILLKNTLDRNPVIDGITTIFSILGMYLTVKRCVEQWLVWAFVNGLSFIMWFQVALSGAKVYSTVFMWFVYFILAIYFYITWQKEIKKQTII